MTLHIVKRDETLSSIAQRYDSTASALAAANQLGDGGKLAVGQALLVPPYGKPGRSILVNGYALPGIADAALYGSLPYLSFLTPLAYRARADGSLSELADSSLIRQAYSNDVAPLLALSNRREGGGLDGEAGRLLTDRDAQEAFVENLLALLQEKSYMGLHMDFAHLRQDDAGAYAEFLRRLKQRLAPGGYLLSAALAAKAGGEQTNDPDDGSDYAALSEICDFVVLLPPEGSPAYGPPRAPAPIGQLKQALAHALRAIPGGKLLLGIPNCGYNWTLPFDKTRPARVISLAEAPRLACENFADIRYDQEAQAPYFQFYDSNGTEHIVWFDDPRSILARLALVEEFELGGISYGNIDRLYRPGFLALASMFRSETMF